MAAAPPRMAAPQRAMAAHVARPMLRGRCLRRAPVARLVGRSAASWLRKLFHAGRPMDSRPWRNLLRHNQALRPRPCSIHRTAMRSRARPCGARYIGGGRRRASAVRRCSGIVATANFLLGFVWACPGRPMKFPADIRYRADFGRF
ncbi:hypothetical protein F511_13571 [Dorcoceras hygrometricum]|uniref:Uncharacterized protein n=1 Tax=Dorcoceras hygrometricum TaxID=472368 RepID=A0A2Z7D0Y0_9LAMI|nr:hypothetical protein F511_13571 [Dorcoceras hygrometricum]